MKVRGTLWSSLRTTVRPFFSVSFSYATLIEGDERARSPGRIGAAFAVTDHRVMVQEVFKGQLDEGSTVSVIVPIGSVTTADGVTHDSYSSGRRKFVPGEDLVLFLKLAPVLGGYDVAYGSVGHYAVDGPTVAIPFNARGWSLFAGRASMSSQEFLVRLRDFKAKVGR